MFRTNHPAARPTTDRLAGRLVAASAGLPAQNAAFIAAEQARWEMVVMRAKIKPGY